MSEAGTPGPGGDATSRYSPSSFSMGDSQMGGTDAGEPAARSNPTSHVDIDAYVGNLADSARSSPSYTPTPPLTEALEADITAFDSRYVSDSLHAGPGSGPSVDEAEFEDLPPHEAEREPPRDVADDLRSTPPWPRPSTPARPSYQAGYLEKPPPTLDHPAAVLEWLMGFQQPEDQALARIALIAHLGLMPCPEQHHASYAAAHDEATDFHLPLRSTYPRSQAGRHGPQGIHPELGLDRGDRPLPSKLMATSRSAFPPAAVMQAAFTGGESLAGEGAQICLHLAHRPAALTPFLPDIDSSITLTSRLDDFRGDLHLVPTQAVTELLGKNIHITLPFLVPTEDPKSGIEVKKSCNVPLHHIPHCVLGHDGEHHPVYAFFPRMYDPAFARKEGRGRYLTDSQHSALFDGLVLRAAHASNPNLSQRVPQSVRLALAVAQARLGEGAGLPSRGAPVSYPIPAEALGPMWRAMADTMEAAGLAPSADEAPIDYTAQLAPPAADGPLQPFAGMFFLYDCKGLKLRHQTKGTITDCLHHYWSSPKTCIPLLAAAPGDLFRQQFLDLAFDFVPRYHPKNKTTLLARRCCLHNTFRFLQAPQAEVHRYVLADPAEEPAAQPWEPAHFHSNTRTTEYPVHLLRDAVSLTSEPTPKNWLYQQGVRYVQSYFIGKHRFDALGVYPFTHPSILHLGYSEDTWREICGRANIPPSRERGAHARDRSAARVLAAMSEEVVSHGWRFEVRLTARAAMRLRAVEVSLLRAALGIHGHPHDPHDPHDPHERRPAEPAMTACPRAFFHIPSAEFRRFLYGNIDKPLLVMDVISAYYGGERRSPQAAATLYAAMALYLQHFIAPVPFRFAGFFQRGPGDGRAGLGVSASREACGFGFLPPDVPVDWDTLQVAGHWLGRLEVPEFRIASHLHGFKDRQGHNSFLEQVLELARPGLSQPQKIFLVELVVDILLREYRRTALEKLFPLDWKRSLRRHYDEDLAEFTVQGMRELAAEAVSGRRPVAVVTGNRSYFKDPLSFFQWTWGNLPVKARRDRIQTLAFRLYYHMARDALAACGDKGGVLSPAVLEDMLFLRFFQQHTAFPYPDSNGSLSATHKNASRLLFAVRHEPSPYSSGPRELFARSTDTFRSSPARPRHKRARGVYNIDSAIAQLDAVARQRVLSEAGGDA